MKKKTRHYQKSENIIVRTKEDFSGHKAAMKFLNSAFFKTTALDTTDEKNSYLDTIDFKPEEPSIVSSVEGKMSKIFLTIPKYAILDQNNNPYWNAYSDLILQLPEYTNFFIMTHEAVENELKDWLEANNIIDRATVQSLPNHLHFSVWAEDGHAITKDANGSTFFAQPFSFPRYADGLLARYASNVSDFENYPAPLYFQGGNILIGDNFFFIGADYPKNSLDYVGKVIIPENGESDEALIKRLYKTYLDTSKELYYVGSQIPVPSQRTERITVDGDPNWHQLLYFGNKEGTVQPLFHIDMFISLAGRNAAGKYQILVGDPKMAAELINFPESLKYAMVNVFDNIAAQLSRNPDFEVIRNPLPLVYIDDESKKERVWYFATSNNCLVENTKHNKTVWLPTYGHGNWKRLVRTDLANAKIWQRLGYKVKMLEDFHPFTENLGAVHCISKYLERGAEKPIVS
ncbi:hypothetical protein [uncultured Kordia sp.]|uniref:hypothetical protein n=1 Tax=uncultured Kordia sp. TaxID=507699 RepID=UPI0026162DDE|nr:hypothetical protein [uncultured Kordia sp.]